MASSPFFQVQRRTARRVGTSWRASAEILRADTGEVVARLRLRDPEEEAVKARLEAAIAEALAALPPPGDWGRDPTVPQLIHRYLALRDEVYGKVLDADPTARGLDEAETARLAARVEALSEAQRLELATPDPAVLEDPEDPWNLDELTARRALGRMITRPSEAVMAAMERLCAGLERE